MNQLKKPKKLSLYKALEIGYLRDENKQKKKLKKFGYKLLPDQTNREHLAAYNPESKKLLYVSNGTDFSNKTDITNDLLGAIGQQRNSTRTKEEKNALLKAKNNVKPEEVVLVGHSLGAQYTNYIASKNDKVIQYNPYYTMGATERQNVKNYRTKNDLVSLYSPKENTEILNQGFINPVKAHHISNIKNEPIFV